MVKPLDLNGGEKFHEDKSSKDQMAKIVKPRFLKLDIIPYNLSIHLKIDLGVFLQRLRHYYAQALTFR